MRRELCISLPRHESRVQPLATPEHEIRISFSKCESCIQPKTAPECETRVSLQKREPRIQLEAMSECDLHVLLLKREIHVQPQLAKFKPEQGSPHPYGFRLDPQTLLRLIRETTCQERGVFIKSLLSVIASSSSRRCSMIAILTFK